MSTDIETPPDEELARLNKTLTPVSVSELLNTALLGRVCVDPKCAQSFRSSMTIGADPVEIVHCPVINRASAAAGGRMESMDASSPADALRIFLRMWRIVTLPTVRGEVLPYGIRNEGGFVCIFCRPDKWHGQDERYAAECEDLRKQAAIMCAALNQQVTG